MGKDVLWLKAHKACRENLFECLCSMQESVGSLKQMVLSNGIIRQVEDSSTCEDDLVCFAAGGFACDSFLDMGLCLSSASALFWKSGNILQGEFVRDMSIDILSGPDALSSRASLVSDTLRLKNALSAIETKKPRYLVLDLSLHEAYVQNPLPFSEYQSYRKTVLELLSVCRKNSIIPVGLSRGLSSVVFRNHLKDSLKLDLPDALTDNILLSMLVKKYPFRTESFFPTSQFGLEESGAGFKTTYLGVKSTSMPLRIDIPSWADDLDSITSFIYGLSKKLGYPPALHIASRDSQVTEKDIRSNTQKLVVYLSNRGNSVFSDIALQYYL